MPNFKNKLPLFQKNDVQISNVVNTVWSIANTLRGAYRADKYHSYVCFDTFRGCLIANER